MVGWGHNRGRDFLKGWTQRTVPKSNVGLFCPNHRAVLIILRRTYDEYVSELASGHLSWSPVHESDDFWKENATRLNENDYEQLKSLRLLWIVETMLTLQFIQDLNQDPQRICWSSGSCSRSAWYRPICQTLRTGQEVCNFGSISDLWLTVHFWKARRRPQWQDQSDGVNDTSELWRSLSRTPVSTTASEPALGNCLKAIWEILFHLDITFFLLQISII